MEELLEVGKKASKHARKLGVDEAEIFLYKENLTSIKFVGGIFASRGGALKGLRGSLLRIAEPWIKKKGLPVITGGVRAGVGIRVVVKKAIGFASVSSIKEKKIMETVENATKIAKIRPPDPSWDSLPKPKKPRGQNGISDEKIQNLDIDETLKLCVDSCIVAGDFDRKITQAMMGLSASAMTFAVINTKDIEVGDKGTTFTVFMATKAKSGNEEVSSSDMLMSRTYIENLQEFATNTSRNAIECLGKKPLPEKHIGPVVFENISWHQLFSTIFTPSISALNVQENRSIYKGQIGKQIAEKSLEVVDDGTLLEGFGTTIVDDEGTPKQRTPVIENGALQNFLYDNYSAKRENKESTGNANRHRPPIASYANIPMIRPTNLVIQPQRGNLENLVSENNSGVLVKGSLIGVHTSNVITGDFSVTADNAFKIENGRVAYPLKACTVAGNLYESLKSIIAVGNDSKCFGNVICPSVAVEKIVVAT
ncbi:MAG: TldD/PmbA family protein [Candidatus Bathyarchaeota archaeon]|nr:MAG: TldD/PmbA family protein [Candidatus Bathyarchaeota archaeon]